MTRLRACPGCGRPTAATRCPACAVAERARRYARRPRGNRPEVRRRVLDRDGWACVRCGLHDPTGRELEVDHIVRRVDGGGDHEANLRTLCRACHLRSR